MTFQELKENRPLVAVGSSNFLLFVETEFKSAIISGNYEQKIAREIRSFTIFDKHFNEVWQYKFNNSGTKEFDMFEYYSSEGNDMILKRNNFEKVER